MKKLMILAAVAAMASGAWADRVNYEFKLTCQEVPTSYAKLGADAYFCLIDPRMGGNGTIIAYVQPKDFDGEKMEQRSKPGDTHYKEGAPLNADVIKRAAGFLVIDGKSYDVAAHDVKSSEFAPTTIQNTYNTPTKEAATLKDVEFSIFASSENEDVIKLMRRFTETGKTDLLAVIWDNENKFYQQYDVDVTGLSTTKLFSAAGPYSSVPEPTSGLLMLLGLAGLALKRKVA